MNTTIIKAEQKERLQVMEIIQRKLNRAIRPVTTFIYDFEENTMVVSGCSTTEFLSAIPESIGKKIEVVRAS